MSNNGPEQPDERLSEELVAYLDGELSDVESESVESRIGHDDRARTELQKLDRVWNALDELPRATVDDSFTRTTIEMATIAAKKELAEKTAMLPIRRRQRWVKLAVLGAAAALAGFAALAALLPDPNRQLYTNLPVVMELDAYSEVRDINFLRLLNAESGDWMLGELGCEVDKRAQSLADLNTAGLAVRKQYVDALTTDQRTDLASKHRRYQSLTPEMREQLTAWHTQLASEPDADELQRIMLAYYAWVSRESEVDQARLRTLDPQQRVARVEDMQRRNQSRLSAANELALREAFESMVASDKIQKLHNKFVAALPSEEKLGKPDNPEEYFRKRLVQMFTRSTPRRAIPMVEWLSGFARTPVPYDEFNAYRDAIEHDLIAAMDRQTQERLRNEDQGDRSRQLAEWLNVAKRNKKPDVATLEEFFVSGNLPADVQQRLLALPREEMLQELERLYVDEFLGDEGDEDFRERLRGYGRGGRRWDDRDRGGKDGRDDRDRRGKNDRDDKDGRDGRGDRNGRGERNGRDERRAPDERGPRGFGPPGEGSPGDRPPPPPI